VNDTCSGIINPLLTREKRSTDFWAALTQLQTGLTLVYSELGIFFGLTYNLY